MSINYGGIPIFKGLQKPLEFMGIRGRFLTYAAGAIGVSFLGFLLSSILFPLRQAHGLHHYDRPRRRGHHHRLCEAAQRTAQQEAAQGHLLLHPDV